MIELLELILLSYSSSNLMFVYLLTGEISIINLFLVLVSILYCLLPLNHIAEFIYRKCMKEEKNEIFYYYI